VLKPNTHRHTHHIYAHTHITYTHTAHTIKDNTRERQGQGKMWSLHPPIKKQDWYRHWYLGTDTSSLSFHSISKSPHGSLIDYTFLQIITLKYYPHKVSAITCSNWRFTIQDLIHKQLPTPQWQYNYGTPLYTSWTRYSQP